VLEGVFQLLKFVIHGDSQCLEDASRRFFLGLASDGGWQCRLDRRDQICRRKNRLAPPLPHDLLGNHSTESLFAEVPKDRCQLVHRSARQQFDRRLALRDIESHVQRTFGAEAETSLPVRQLIRRQTQVDQNTIDAGDAKLAKHNRKFVVTGVTQVTPFARYDRRRMTEHHGIAVETNQGSAWRDSFEDLSTMPAAADGSVNDDEPRTQIQRLK
jgi:hypothetical protein